jgi:hypothetical protein
MQADSGRDDSQVENWLVMDDWQVVNESATGLCLARPLREGVRHRRRLLVAVKIGSSERFMLACVRWALRGADDSCCRPASSCSPAKRARLRSAPSIRARMPAPGNKGLLLPEIPALREPTSLVVPAGTFKLERASKSWWSTSPDGEAVPRPRARQRIRALQPLRRRLRRRPAARKLGAGGTAFQASCRRRAAR